MVLIGSRTIAASTDVVWQAILSADVLQACVPGCTEMSGSPEDGFEATVVQKVGPVKATFKGVVTLSNMVPRTSLMLSGEGKGGAAGFARGGAKVHLEAEGSGTVLHYNVEAKVGGNPSRMGHPPPRRSRSARPASRSTSSARPPKTFSKR
ncbi:carbon monoxide dehydrogenase [Ruegeria pomeroyi]|nr:carbon monoxide dehydrogenase [Ruegeria pomeroyi]MCE8531447.1 carbon monoxide dehydrogenase [Ruegeria pomeroyi]